MQFERITGRSLIQCSVTDFEATALALFQYQYQHNSLYKAYNDALHIVPAQINSMEEIPFLPISFFKTHRVVSGDWQKEELLFESSGTTGVIPSRHFVKDADIYEAAMMSGFRQFYGGPKDYAILALLPSYLERGQSSLVHMAKVLMDKSGHSDNGFYLNEWPQLSEKLLRLKSEGQKVLLLGVTFALLDFAEMYPMDLSGIVVMETGGMKGRREEWTRAQVHDYLKERWHIDQIHSEYGMTELLSQAYALDSGIFEPIATMRVFVRDIQDPLDISKEGIGAINIIDLANINSCAFIATEDIGRLKPNHTFEVLGRMDHVALRGCSLMAL
jgi:hypothetical protein